ncbi:unnamed protein product, partial [Meganyctiphanes norvegica]
SFSCQFFTKNLENTAESVRMEEKMRYKQLIQEYNNSQSSSLLAPSFTSADSIITTPSLSCGSSSRLPTYRVTLWPNWATQKKKKKKSPFGNFWRPDGSANISYDQNCKSNWQGITSNQIIRSDNKESNNDAAESDSDSIIMMGEIKKPRSHPNALEQFLKKSPYYNDNWLKSLNDKYESRDVPRDSKALEEEKMVQKCSERSEKIKRSLEQRVIRRMRDLDITFPSKIQELEPEKEDLAELTEEMENMIDNWLRGNPGQQLTEKFSIQITRRDIHTLADLNWLNDEVINFYMNLLVERGQSMNNMLSVHAFNTFFYPKLVKTGYATIKRWTKKVDVFSQDLLIIPVHLGMHWCLATVDFRDKTIRYYDSMLGDNDRCLQALLEYLKQEHQDKKKSPYNTDDWSIQNVKKIKKIINGQNQCINDCGICLCRCLKFLICDIVFSKKHHKTLKRSLIYSVQRRAFYSPGNFSLIYLISYFNSFEFAFVFLLNIFTVFEISLLLILLSFLLFVLITLFITF